MSRAEIVQPAIDAFVSIAGKGLVDIFNGMLRETLKADLFSLDNFSTNGQTALMAAVQGGCVEIVQAIIDSRKAKPNIQDRSGNTALHIAAQKGNAALFELLVLNGGDLSIKNQKGSDVVSVIDKDNPIDVEKILAKLKEAKDKKFPSPSPSLSGSQTASPLTPISGNSQSKK